MIRIIRVNMAQVSKRKLTPKTEVRLFKIFWETISELKGPINVEEFFTDLLTPTERIMLAKRLAIAVMLLKGYGYESIENSLKVTSGTISSVALWLKHSGSGYRKMVEKLAKKEKFQELLDGLESAIELLKPEKTFSRVLYKGFPKGKFKEPF